MSAPAIRILEWQRGSDCGLLAQAEAVFWETSLRPYPPGPEREAFRERWFGRFLQGGSDVVLLAVAADATVAGYLVGAVEDPAPQARFADLGYFRCRFPALTQRFPAHLHINLTARWRGQGIGARLIEAFAARSTSAGAAGMHAITGKGMRNVAFYRRCGFTQEADTIWNERHIVFLARALPAR